MTTPREIYENELPKPASRTPIGIVRYGQGCWRAALRGALQAKIEGVDVPDNTDVSAPDFWAGVDAVRAAIQKLLISRSPQSEPAPPSAGAAFDDDPQWKNSMELAAGNGYHRGRRDAAQEFQTFIVSLASKYADEQFRYVPPWAQEAQALAEQDIKRAREKESGHE